MIEKNSLSKIGIGTWGIGGLADPNPKNNDRGQIEALTYSLNRGINYFETVYMYAKGRAVDLLSQAFKSSRVKRENVFITLSIYQQTVSTLVEAEQEVEKFLGQLGIDYVDSVQFSMGLINKLGLENTQDLVKKLINQGRSQYTSLTNANLEFLKKYHQAFGGKLFAHEGVFNFEIRINEDQGIITYAQENNILNVIYQPLRRNRTALRNWPLLLELSQKYQRTQNQIILNWIVSKGFFPLVKSTSVAHIDENLESFNFKMSEEDYKKLNKFRVPGFEVPAIDWYDTGDGIKIHQLPNVFDDLYPTRS